MSSMQPVLLTFPAERPLFLKEENSKMYSVTPYYFGRTILELPLNMIIPLLFSSIVYFSAGFNSDEAFIFFNFVLTTILLSLVGNSMGLLVGSFFDEPKLASAMAPLIFIPMMLFSGFYKQRETLSPIVSWIEYITPLKYAFEAFVTNEY